MYVIISIVLSFNVAPYFQLKKLVFLSSKKKGDSSPFPKKFPKEQNSITCSYTFKIKKFKLKFNTFLP